jgi:hypothetical protein
VDVRKDIFGERGLQVPENVGGGRTYNSFREIGEDAGNSRLYAGLHYQLSIDAGLIQGRKVTANIFDLLGLPSKQNISPIKKD